MVFELAYTAKFILSKAGCDDMTDVFLQISSPPWTPEGGVHLFLKALNEPPESGGGLWLNPPLEGVPGTLTTRPEYAPVGAAGPDPPAQ